ncbi:MAG TPA: ABC transporter permease [Thermoanaerobaculia bacterium]|jgi:putative ABC transport system permease protein|nr:ABC transporter permease [Thermoanaerobaculia bacterium]
MRNFLRDLRLGARSLARRPAFLVLATASLALGIGANAAIWSVLDAVLIRAVPFVEPDRLVLIWGVMNETGNRRDQVSSPDIEDLRRQSKTLEEVAAYMGWVPVLSGAGEPERVPAIQVSDGYFRILRGTALLGRTFVPEDQVDGKDRVVVLAHGFWQRRFGGDPGIIGKEISLNGRNHTVVGVMPADFSSLPRGLIGQPAELYRPLAEPYDDTARDGRHVRGIARIVAGATLTQARVEIETIAARLAKAYPNDDRGRGFNPVPLAEDQVGGLRTPLLAVFGAVGLVLAIACVNVANLLFARAARRKREVAIRSALGASRRQLIGQFLAEGLALAAAGGAAGLLVAAAGIRAIERYATEWLPSFAEVRLDSRVFLFALFLTLITGVLFGLAPALRSSRPAAWQGLRQGARSTSGGPRADWTRGALVAAQLAISLVLLAGAGLLVRSVVALYRVDPGFDPRGVLTLNINLPGASYPKSDQWLAFADRLSDRLKALPGVNAVGFSSVMPMSDNFDGRSILPEGLELKEENEVMADLYAASPGYLDALRIPLRAGRRFTAADRATTPFVALVNETLAKTLWPGQNPLGRRIKMEDGDLANAPWRTVIGVLADVRQYGLDRNVPMQMYFPQAQEPGSFMSLAVRAEGDPDALLPAVRREILALDPTQAVFDVASLPRRIDDSLALRRFALVLLGLFAAVGLALALLGVYGVLALLVAERMNEIGVRLALGARGSNVVSWVVARGMLPAVAGLGVGLVASLALSRFLSGLLYGVTATDAPTLGGVSALLLLAALAACLLPARRAAKTDPIVALRAE